MKSVLVVDDDPKIVKMLGRTLAYEGFHVVTAADGNAALAQVQEHRPDIIVLDWLMPGLDGIGAVKRLRDAGDKTLVLMLTARDDIENRVEGLQCGADDYLIKPFAPSEMLARIHALLRRSSVQAKEPDLMYSDLTLSVEEHKVLRGTRVLELTLTEFDLLHYFMLHPRQVLQRVQILHAVWGYAEGEENVLEVYIGYLRKKMELNDEPRLIQTVRGAGYVLRED